MLWFLDEGGQPLPPVNPVLPFNVRSCAFDAPDGTPAQAVAVMGPAELRVTTSEPVAQRCGSRRRATGQ